MKNLNSLELHNNNGKDDANDDDVPTLKYFLLFESCLHAIASARIRLYKTHKINDESIITWLNIVLISVL